MAWSIMSISSRRRRAASWGIVATNRKSKKEDERAEHAAANMAGDRLAEILSKDLDAEDGEHEQRGGNAEGQSRRC